VRRNIGRDQKDPIQPELPVNFLRGNEVADMGRVEGAAEDAEAGWRLAAGT
jgi:hypothetical protein